MLALSALLALAAWCGGGKKPDGAAGPSGWLRGAAHEGGLAPTSQCRGAGEPGADSGGRRPRCHLQRGAGVPRGAVCGAAGGPQAVGGANVCYGPRLSGLRPARLDSRPAAAAAAAQAEGRLVSRRVQRVHPAAGLPPALRPASAHLPALPVRGLPLPQRLHAPPPQPGLARPRSGGQFAVARHAVHSRRALPAAPELWRAAAHRAAAAVAQGRFEQGGIDTSLYDARFLAGKYGVMVVTIQYRCGEGRPLERPPTR